MDFLPNHRFYKQLHLGNSQAVALHCTDNSKDIWHFLLLQEDGLLRHILYVTTLKFCTVCVVKCLARV